MKKTNTLVIIIFQINPIYRTSQDEEHIRNCEEEKFACHYEKISSYLFTRVAFL